MRCGGGGEVAGAYATGGDGSGGRVAGGGAASARFIVDEDVPRSTILNTRGLRTGGGDRTYDICGAAITVWLTASYSPDEVASKHAQQVLCSANTRRTSP